MRVALTCDWFLKYAAAQSVGLARAGADVLLLCRTHANEFGGDQRERAAAVEDARRAGVQVIELPGRLSDPRVAPALLKLRGQLARFAPEVVHAHDRADPRALLLLPRRPIALTVHDPVSHPGQPVASLHKRWFLNGSHNAWRGGAHTIVVHSERLRREVQLRDGQRCVVVPHGLHTLERPLPPPAALAVGFFGRLEPYKGLDVLAAAMPIVWAVRPDVALHVAGAGASVLPLDDSRVQLQRGYLPEAEVERFFEQLSLAVLPYTQASQTGAGSVAVGHGVPLIVSRLGGLPDLALDRTYTFAPGDAAGLAGAIIAHIEDGAEVRGRVLADVAGPHSWDAVAARSLELYEQMLSQR